MSGKTFEGQVARMGWVPGAEPRPELVEAILRHHGKPVALRDITPTVLGVCVGALIGLLIKGLALATLPWGADGGWLGMLAGLMALLGGLMSVAGAVFAAMVSRRHPVLMQFASVNLLTLLIVIYV
ncbi:hypothetical protein [Tritonibacter horizontis]|uniref:Uncharacterized protein n=1 Tax=Tritonibacter horizontis TaxID=1768241 RepID=A0A132BVT0_9RHOB|nr:hypothetical protein [Tritonibacter horizontis]KUP92489.1 hypothetical protein TRIHO_24590 [Tritonibacter horizontis]